MKNKVISIIVCLLIAVTGSCFLFGCDKKEEQKELETLIKPANMPDWSLTLEFLDEKGITTDYKANKPTVFLFAGVGNGEKLSYKLDSNEYHLDGDYPTLSENSKNINYDMAYYWSKAGYNVGIYHYENFAVCDNQTFEKKIYSSKNLSYIDMDGKEIFTEDLGFSLTEMFVYLWNSILTINPYTGENVSNALEVRFVANGVGVCLANSIAEYTLNMYKEGLVKSNSMPNRITMCEPYFETTKNDISSIDYTSNFTHTSSLEYNADLVEYLAKKGVVYEYIVRDTALTEGNEYIDKITKNSATFTLWENYSNYLSEDYQKQSRIALDWYLYSIYGSDDPVAKSIINKGINNSSSMVNDITNYPDGRMYCVSAWTPTVYIRALRGNKFSMHKRVYDSVDDCYKISGDYYLSCFMSETYQIGDVTKTLFCGYVFQNDTPFINWSIGGRIEGAEVKLSIQPEDETQTEKTITTKTDSDGFYCFEYNPKYYNRTNTITFIIPLPKLNYMSSDNSKYSTYEKYSMNTIIKEKTELDSLPMETNSEFCAIVVRNCGLSR